MSDIQVYDQFLKEDDFKKLDRVFCQDVATWHYNDVVVSPTEDDNDYNFQFTHSIYKDLSLIHIYENTRLGMIAYAVL